MYSFVFVVYFDTKNSYDYKMSFYQDINARTCYDVSHHVFNLIPINFAAFRRWFENWVTSFIISSTRNDIRCNEWTTFICRRHTLNSLNTYTGKKNSEALLVFRIFHRFDISFCHLCSLREDDSNVFSLKQILDN